MNHEQYEINVEKKRRGQLPREESASLDRHLLDCHTCRQFEALTVSESAAMSARAQMLEERVDWAALTKEVSRAKRSVRAGLLVYGLVSAMLVLASIFFSTQGSGPSAASLLMVFGFIFGVMAVDALLRERRARKDSPVKFLRKELTTSLRLYRGVEMWILISTFCVYDPSGFFTARPVIELKALSLFDSLVALALISAIEWFAVRKYKRGLQQLG